MNKKAKFPLTMRILAALGMLEGRGIIATTLIVLMVAMFSAILIYQGYVGWAILIVGIVLFVVYVPRQKRQFRTIKRRYGITIDPPYDLEHLTRLLLEFNENSDIVLGIGDYTFIKIDGSPFPLVLGSVSYGNIRTEGTSDTISAVFLLVLGSDFSDLQLKYGDVFEPGGQRKEISVYWVKNPQRITAILTPGT